MLTASQIPELSGSTAIDATNWWRRMIELGFNINPDEDPASCIDVETGLASFDASACAKIQSIYHAMFERFGDDVYELAQTAYMAWMGHQKNPTATAENGEDFWIPTVKP